MRKLIVLSLIFAFFLYFIFYIPCFKFIPVEMQSGYKNRLVYNYDLQSRDFYKNLKKVFNFYSIKYSQSKDGSLIITLKLHLDKELCWNFTTKAKDSQWISTHYLDPGATDGPPGATDTGCH